MRAEFDATFADNFTRRGVCSSVVVKERLLDDSQRKGTFAAERNAAFAWSWCGSSVQPYSPQRLNRPPQPSNLSNSGPVGLLTAIVALLPRSCFRSPCIVPRVPAVSHPLS